jgi:hypothetical protein
MSVFTLVQTSKYRYVDLLFASFALTLVLLILVPPTGNIYSSIYTAPRSIDNIHTSVSIQEINKTISFAADRQYWVANCSQGWSSDARCNTIVVRAQSCSISMASAYCSQYENYLQE